MLEDSRHHVTPSGPQEVALLQPERHADGQLLSQDERERLVKTHLPSPRSNSPSLTRDRPSRLTFSHAWHRPRVRPTLAVLLYKALFILVQLGFSCYIRMRQACHAILAHALAIIYYHHRSPDLILRDVKNLDRLPKHLGITLDLQNEGTSDAVDGVSKLISEVAEVAAWGACAGIPMLSVYEPTGVIKVHVSELRKVLYDTLQSYFPPSSIPSYRIRAPRVPIYSPPGGCTTGTSESEPVSLEVLLISSVDGRATLVDLTKTLAEMSQRGKLLPSDISTELIDAEVTESSCGEPDLLVCMASGARGDTSRLGKMHTFKQSGLDDWKRDMAGTMFRGSGGISRGGGEGGGDVCLHGYPPWQIRLTELSHMPDGSGVEYETFLRGLYQYAKAEMRFGR